MAASFKMAADLYLYEVKNINLVCIHLQCRVTLFFAITKCVSRKLPEYLAVYIYTNRNYFTLIILLDTYATIITILSCENCNILQHNIT